jgi:LacI family transcriptional regulator
MTKRITIQDISELSGTSPSTVSRVLTGNAVVSPAKRAAIEAAIQRLNYRPSHLARGLKTRTTYSIGLLLNDITNPFYSAIARGAEEAANQEGYSLILCNTNEDPARELQYLQVLEDKHVDGILLGPTGHNQHSLLDLAARIPVVQVDRQIQPDSLSAVLVDNEYGAYTAVQQLIRQGHRQIALVGWKENITTMSQRQAGYERALIEAGITPDPQWIIQARRLNASHTAELIYPRLKTADRPTALFACNNQLGLGALSAIQQAELKIPDDIALIIFDDLEVFAVIKPSITVVRQPAFEMGQEAMRLLIRQIESPDDTPPETVILPTELILRESI